MQLNVSLIPDLEVPFVEPETSRTCSFSFIFLRRKILCYQVHFQDTYLPIINKISAQKSICILLALQCETIDFFVDGSQKV